MGEKYHFAEKKIPYIQYPSMDLIDPVHPNGIKLEMFIFDCFSLASNTVLIEVDRAEEFAPVKNASGASSDTPEHAVKAYVKRCWSWLKAYKGGEQGAETDIGVKDIDELPFILLSPLQAYNKFDDSILKEIVLKGEIKFPFTPIFD